MLAAGAAIREATIVDADAIGLVHRIGLQGLVTAGLPQAALAISAVERGLEWREWLRAKGMGRAAGIVLVGETVHGPIGFVCAAPSYPPQAPDVWSIPHLYVLPAHQKQGLGHRLLRAALERMAARGVVSAELDCPAGADLAGFAEAAGGVRAGQGDLTLFGAHVAVDRWVFDLTASHPGNPVSGMHSEA